MKRRQSRFPRQWVVVTGQAGSEDAARRVRPGTGVLVLQGRSERQLARLRRFAAARGLSLVDESRDGARRVHDLRELRSAMLARSPMIFLSPIYPTGSHPGWRPIPRMRAAAMARLAGRSLFALGGMDERRFRRLERLGFRGWAGVSAFRT